MRSMDRSIRTFLSGLMAILGWIGNACAADPAASPQTTPARPRIAAIVTTYFPRSHAGILVDKFLRGFPTDEGVLPPRTEIASLYIDQIHQDDIGRQVAHEYHIPLYESIRAALTLGGDTLAVDAVLLIGEHGDYPTTPLDQEMLPRRFFFEQIAAVIEHSRRPIPVFVDKHLAYRWEDARWMYETARRLKIPLWAGSAMPVTWRNPQWEHPLGQPIDQALAISHHMVERYGFHALEILQCHVERRRGGETGVRSVRCLAGDAVWQAAKEGLWSYEMANNSLEQLENGPGKLDPTQIDDPHVFLIEYVDGLRAAVLMLGERYLQTHTYAQRSDGKIVTLEHHAGPSPPNGAFGYLGRNIETFFLTGETPNPIERTYLTTGILEAAMISRAQDGQVVPTPHLATITYQPHGTPLRPTQSQATGGSLTEWPMLQPGATPQASSIPTIRDGTTRGKK